MKLIMILAAFAFYHASYGQTDCRPYVPITKGTKWELTNYSEKGDATGKVAYELMDKVESGNDLTFTIKAVFYDKKGKETFTNTFEAQCVGGEFQMDMAFKMDGAAMQAYQNMEVDVDASNLEIPSMDAAAGTTLEDGSLAVKIGTGGATMFTMTVLVTNRQVEAREDLKTPAGTFNCIKLSQDVSTKMLVKIEASSKEWYAEEIGLVRSESYDKKGKLSGYSELTKLERK